MLASCKAAAFLLLTFGIGWPAAFAAWMSGMHSPLDPNPSPYFSLFGAAPLIAALLCTLAFERGTWADVLGLRLVPSRWWLVALLIFPAAAALATAVNIVLAGDSPFDLAQWSAALAAIGRSPLAAKFPNLGMAFIGFILVATITEEIGWRGYLYHQWRRFGFWQSTLATGLIWGIWHWPMELFFDVFHPLDRWLGLVVYPFQTLLLAVYATWLRDRGRSVLAPGIFHGTVQVLGIAIGFSSGSYVAFAALIAGAIFIVLSERRVTGRDRGITAREAAMERSG